MKMVMTTVVLAAVVGTGSDDEYSSSTALISLCAGCFVDANGMLSSMH